MLAKRIIPTILVRGRQMVKGVAFNSWRSVGLAAQAVRIHSMRGVDEIVLLDISATAEGRGPDLKLVEELAATCYMPLSVGGGVRTVNDVKNLLRAGADKVVIGTAAVEDIHFISEVTMRVGAQAIVASIDVKDGQAWKRSGTVPVTKADSIATSSLQFIALSMQDLGCGEILLNSIRREGTLKGYDLDLIKMVSNTVNIPVIASCGAGSYEHMREAIEAGADAVAAGAMFQFTDQTPREAAEYLASKQIEVRL